MRGRCLVWFIFDNSLHGCVCLWVSELTRSTWLFVDYRKVPPSPLTLIEVSPMLLRLAVENLPSCLINANTTCNVIGMADNYWSWQECAGAMQWIAKNPGKTGRTTTHCKGCDYANYLAAAIINQFNWPPAVVLDPHEDDSSNVAGCQLLVWFVPLNKDHL